VISLNKLLETQFFGEQNPKIKSEIIKRIIRLEKNKEMPGYLCKLKFALRTNKNITNADFLKKDRSKAMIESQPAEAFSLDDVFDCLNPTCRERMTM